MLHAQNRHAISAKTTASGRDPAAKATPAGIDAAMAAPGAMSVMLWNRTSRRPIASRRNPTPVSVRSAVATAASLDGPKRSLPGCSHGRQGPGQTPGAPKCGALCAVRPVATPGSAGAVVTVRAETLPSRQRDHGGDVRGQPYPVAVADAHVGARQHTVVVDEGAVGGVLVPDHRVPGITDRDRSVPP